MASFAPTLLSLATFAGLVVLGGLCAATLLPRRGWFALIGAAFPLGLGVTTWTLFLISWAGAPLSPAVLHGALAALILFSLAGFLRFGHGRSAGAEGEMLSRGSRTAIVGAASGIALLLVAALALAVLRSYSTWDAMAIWASKGYGIALAQSVFGAQEWGSFGLNYPLNIPLAIAVFRIIGGDLLPESTFVFPLFYASLLFAAFGFLRRGGRRATPAAVGALLVGSLPIVFDHASQGYANLPLAVYLILGTLRAIEATLDEDPRGQALSGLFFGLACWTRPEGVLLSAATAAGLTLALRYSLAGRQSQVQWLLPMTAVALPWIVFTGSYGRESLMTETLARAGAALAGGDFRLDSFFRIARFMGHQLVRPTVWGGLLPIAVLALALRAGNLRPRILPGSFCGSGSAPRPGRSPNSLLLPVRFPRRVTRVASDERQPDVSCPRNPPDDSLRPPVGFPAGAWVASAERSAVAARPASARRRGRLLRDADEGQPDGRRDPTFEDGEPGHHQATKSLDLGG